MTSAVGVDLAGGGWAVVVLERGLVVDTFRCETFAKALLVDTEAIGRFRKITRHGSARSGASLAA